MTAGIVVVETIGRALTGEQLRFVSMEPGGRSLALAVIGVFSGLAVGCAQWLAARRAVNLSSAWVTWCTVAFALGLPAGALATDLVLGGPQGAIGLTVFLATAGLIVGAVTARPAQSIVRGIAAGSAG